MPVLLLRLAKESARKRLRKRKADDSYKMCGGYFFAPALDLHKEQ